MKKVSIIIATYNASDTLSQTIDSVLFQTYPNIEVIVVDGCSTDGTVDILQKYQNGKIRYLVEEDEGIYDAMNKGVALAQGEWLLFMGADDRLCDKNVIAEMFGSERNSGQYDVIIGDIQFDNNKVRTSSVSSRMKFINTVHHQSAFYRKELFTAFKYNTACKVSGDYELNLLVFLKEMNVLKVNRIICLVGLSGASSKVDFCGYAEEIQIRNKYLKNSPSRMIMNSCTRLRYVLKKAGKLVGWSFHYYN